MDGGQSDFKWLALGRPRSLHPGARIYDGSEERDREVGLLAVTATATLLH